MIKDTRYHSKKIGALAEGCKMCVKGRKLVLFVTGLCSKKCWFCPISDKKKGKDVIFANEWQLKGEGDIKTLFKEAELCESFGAGVTGGDPLVKVDRTVRYIQLLKKRFGKKFHVHLYTPLDLVDEGKLEKLYKAGLDEIRIHPDIYDKSKWENILLFRKYDWKVGMEMPVIPGLLKETKQMIDFFAFYLDFLNLNELEISDTNVDEMIKRRFKPKDEFSYAVKGSEDIAVKLMQYCEKKYPKLDVHFCTTKLKDAVQLAKRIKIRAKNAKTRFDKVTKEGMLVKNCVYLDELKPGFGYRKKLNKALKDKAGYINKLRSLRSKLKKQGIESLVDELKLRLIVSKESIDKVKVKGVSCAEVEEYPTSDGMEVTVKFL